MCKMKMLTIAAVLLLTGCGADVGGDTVGYDVPKLMLYDEVTITVGDYFRMTLPGDSLESVWRIKEINLDGGNPYILLNGEYGYSEELTIYLDRYMVNRMMD